MRVDLPAPFSPTTATISPRSTARWTCASAFTPGKVLVISEATRNGGIEVIASLLAQDLLHLLLEFLDVVLRDRLVLHEDRPVGGDARPGFQRVLAVRNLRQDLDRLVAELIRILHDGADNLAGLHALERLAVFIKGDDQRLGFGGTAHGSQHRGRIVFPEADQAVHVLVLD